MNKNILFFCLISLILCKSPYPIVNDVLVLSEHTFGLAMREFKYLIVLFFDPETKKSQEFLPEFEKMASNLKKENFVFAKIDSVLNEKIASHYDIITFPSVTLFKKSQRIMYEGELKIEEIEKWIKEKTKIEFKKITSKRELENFKKKNKVFLVYFGNDKKAIKELTIAERKVDEIPIVIIDSEQLIKENVNPEKNETFAIFKDFDENNDKKNVFKKKITSKNLLKFIDLYMYPKVLECNKEYSHVIYNKRDPALIIFSTKSERHYDDSLNLFNYMWKNIKSRIRLLVCDIKDPAAAKLVEYCNMTEKTIPKVFIAHFDSEIPSRYEMNGGINEENMMILLNRWSKGKLKPFIRSEEVPKNNDGDLFILVGKNFNKEVLKNDKDVLIYFISPWCKTCEEFEPKLAKLAKKLKEHNPKLLIAKMDSTKNDVEGYVIHNFPTIKFYPGNNKDKEPLELNINDNINTLLELIKLNAYTKIIYDEETDL